ncbi:DUF6364 family protein [Endozoicomonas sp.]|uniref:DUF6364 family protein n=1 Tax=Endozoicomonas sp. TaxID=1892382 RepID=UPI002885F4B4|nr:DUF6364 family protein [Endozoicomonas sp.]
MSKLTLTIDPEVVREAKEYAANNQQSLSTLVENYLKSLPGASSQKKTALNGTVAELAGIISEEEPLELDSYTDYLQGKYQ